MKSAAQHDPNRTGDRMVSMQPSRSPLQRKCACGRHTVAGDQCAACKQNRAPSFQPKLRINKPDDAFEREADRVANSVMSGSPLRVGSARGTSSSLQREPSQTGPASTPGPSQAAKYEAAAKKLGEALLATETGKQLKARAAELGEEFVSTVQGKVVAGTVLGGALTAFIATNSELPAPIPEIPLDFIAPDLKGKLTWDGPVRTPTNAGLVLTTSSKMSFGASYKHTEASAGKPEEHRAGLTFSMPLGAPAATRSKPGPTASEKFRSETARMAAEQARFREGLKTPEQRKAESDAIAAVVGRMGRPDPLGIPGLLTPGSLGRPAKKEEEAIPLQRKADGGTAAGGTDAPSIVHDVLGSPGTPLGNEERAFFEARFGHDFDRVRIRTDSRAAASADAVGAQAYTVGANVVFAAGQYAPTTPAGRQLLAHELVHVVQQAGNRSGGSGELSFPVSQPTRAVQRKVVVDSPSAKPAAAPAGVTNESIAKDYVSKLCGDFTVTGGNVVPVSGACPVAAASSTKTSCECLCETHGSKDTWTIVVDDASWPHTHPGSKTVTVHSPFSGAQFGSWTSGKAEHRMEQPNWLVLGHELCGHARLMASGTHPADTPPKHGGRTDHDVTVGEENKIASEHGRSAAELRGTHASGVHHGESFARVTVAEFPVGSSDVTTLPAAQVANLDKAATFARSGPKIVELIGHADSLGGKAASQTESTRRARSVRKALESRGVVATLFKSVFGVGNAQCPVAGPQPSCRKVDVFMTNQEGALERHR